MSGVLGNQLGFFTPGIVDPSDQYAQRNILFSNTTTNLSAAVNNSQNFITVNSTTGFPLPDFYVTVDTEIMHVTGVAGTVFYVTRSNPVSHSLGASVATTLSATALTALKGLPLNQTGPENTLPLTAYNGRVFKPVDVPYRWIDNGTSWDLFYRGIKVQNYFMPSLSGWTPNNTTSQFQTTFFNTGTTLFQGLGTGSGDNQMYYYISKSQPYTTTAAFIIAYGTQQNVSINLGFRESATGKLEVLQVFGNGGSTWYLAVARYNSDTSYNSNPISSLRLSLNSVIYFRLQYSGTTLTFYYSLDGVNFINFYSESQTSFFTTAPDSVLVGINPSLGSTSAYYSAYLVSLQ